MKMVDDNLTTKEVDKRRKKVERRRATVVNKSNG